MFYKWEPWLFPDVFSSRSDLPAPRVQPAQKNTRREKFPGRFPGSEELISESRMCFSSSRKHRSHEQLISSRPTQVGALNFNPLWTCNPTANSSSWMGTQGFNPGLAPNRTNGIQIPKCLLHLSLNVVLNLEEHLHPKSQLHWMNRETDDAAATFTQPLLLMIKINYYQIAY